MPAHNLQIVYSTIEIAPTNKANSEVSQNITGQYIPTPINSIAVVVIISKQPCVVSFLNNDKCHRRLIVWFQGITRLELQGIG